MMIRKAMDAWSNYKDLYQWNPGNNKWYSINRRNMTFFGVSLDEQRELFNRLLGGETIDVEAHYSKPELYITSENPNRRQSSHGNLLVLL